MKKIINKVLNFSLQKQHNKRSSKKTDLLHKSVIEKYINFYKFDKIKYEEKIPCHYGKTFTVDVALYKNNKLHSVILFKFSLTSILKNKYNISKTTEISRIMGGSSFKENQFNIIFVEFLPEETYALNPKKPLKENIISTYSKMNTLLNNPLYENFNCLYDFRIWFKPNKKFFEAILNNYKNECHKITNDTDFIEDVTLPDNFLAFLNN